MPAAEDTVVWFETEYSLEERDFSVPGGRWAPFEDGVYTARTVADSEEDAVAGLKAMFPGMRVTPLSRPRRRTMTREEYERG